MDVDANADAVVTAIALPVLSPRRAKNYKTRSDCSFKIRLKEPSNQGLYCLPIHLHLEGMYIPQSSKYNQPNFRLITAFWGLSGEVEVFKFFRFLQYLRI